MSGNRGDDVLDLENLVFAQAALHEHFDDLFPHFVEILELQNVGRVAALHALIGLPDTVETELGRTLREFQFGRRFRDA